MKIGGVSVCGSYHKNNQDSYKCDVFSGGFALVVSDGLGSKKGGKIGSLQLCDSVFQVLEEKNSLKLLEEKEGFISAVYENWVKNIGLSQICHCYATALACIVTEDKVTVIRLGDGFIAVKYSNFSEVLLDEKELYFANETDCLDEHLKMEKWEFKQFKREGFQGAIVCSDGVGIYPDIKEHYSDFLTDFLEEYKNKSVLLSETNIYRWLYSWTGTDDKTLAFMINEP